MKTEDYSQLLPHICKFAEEAGKLIHKYYLDKNFTVIRKDDTTPMTQADWEAHLHILKGLTDISSYTVVSEETYKDTDILSNTQFWLVDPLDGTKEFIKGTDDFTVNIALIDGNYPVLGVIYVPCTEELFYASAQGTYKRFKDGTLTRLLTKDISDSQRFLVSRRNIEEREYVKKKWPTASIQEVGSSLKYCRIAEGIADIYIRRLNTSEWDTAAAQCILEQAGGYLCNEDGQRMSYRKPHLKNGPLAAFSSKNISSRNYI